MAIKLYEEEKIQSIANSIRQSTNTNNTYKLKDMSLDLIEWDTMLREWIEKDTFSQLTKLLNSLTTQIPAFSFYNQSNLSHIFLLDSVESIGYRAFENCTNLTMDKLPDNLKIIDNYAFRNCVNLALNKLPDGVEHLDHRAFDNTKIAIKQLPSSLNYLDSYAFNHCPQLKTITFNSKPDYLNSYVFGECYNLKTINVPWSEGEVAYAPWGATNATINYNYTGE